MSTEKANYCANIPQHYEPGWPPNLISVAHTAITRFRAEYPKYKYLRSTVNS